LTGKSDLTVMVSNKWRPFYQS